MVFSIGFSSVVHPSQSVMARYILLLRAQIHLSVPGLL
jgi:hypothetical protein